MDLKLSAAPKNSCTILTPNNTPKSQTKWPYLVLMKKKKKKKKRVK